MSEGPILSSEDVAAIAAQYHPDGEPWPRQIHMLARSHEVLRAALKDPVFLTDAAQALLDRIKRSRNDCVACGAFVTQGITHHDGCEVEALRAALAAGTPVPSREQVAAAIEVVAGHRLAWVPAGLSIACADAVMALLARPSDLPTEVDLADLIADKSAEIARWEDETGHRLDSEYDIHLRAELAQEQMERSSDALRAALAAGPPAPSREQVREAIADGWTNPGSGHPVESATDAVMALLIQPSDPPTAG